MYNLKRSIIIKILSQQLNSESGFHNSDETISNFWLLLHIWPFDPFYLSLSLYLSFIDTTFISISSHFSTKEK